MKAVCWFGKHDVRVTDVPEPQLLNPRDAIVRVTLTAICGSDLHLYDGYVPTMRRGDILGHEFMGEVVDVGSDVQNLQVGDRVVMPFTISCGHCGQCTDQNWALCDNSNPNAWMAEKLYGHSPAGFYGYSHMMGGYPGGQAQYVRVPFADVGPVKVPDDLPDEKVLFLSDIFSTGWQAAEYCHIQPGDIVAVWGCGPVGQFAIRSALMMGAQRVIAIDHYQDRLELAQVDTRVEVLNFDQQDVYTQLQWMTGGRGPDACIEAVGLEAHGMTVDAIYDRIKAAAFMTTDRLHALRQIIRCCRKGGTVSVAGVYGGFGDKFPVGAAFNKGLTIRGGQTHVQRYMQPLMERIRAGEIDPSAIITHRVSLSDAAEAYATFRAKRDGCIKVVMYPFDGV